MSAITIGSIISGFNLLIFGTLLVLGVIFGRRTGGFLAAAGLFVLLFGSVATGALISRTGNFYLMPLPSIIGMLLIAGGVGLNAYRHRMAAEGA